MSPDQNPDELKIINFSFRYRSRKDSSLKNMNLRIRKGEKVLITGMSGCGKTTLVRSINGLIPRMYKGEKSGKILFSEGKELKFKERSRKVGTVLQDTDSQFVGMSVGEDIAFSLENDCVSEEEMKTRVRETAASVGLGDHLHHAPSELSGGQKQKATLAGVLVDSNDILIFDEPLANLDPQAGKEIIELIDKLNKAGKTVIIVEHRLEEVFQKRIDKIFLLREGECIFSSSLSDLLSSGLLLKTGLKEPLLTKLIRYSGGEEIFLKGKEFDSLENPEITSCREKILGWYESQKNNPAPPKKINENILEVKNLDFSYDGYQRVLKEISFEVRKGEILSVLGKNGSGKSTLFKIITGKFKQERGEVLYQGHDITKETVRERSARIGFVMQNPNEMISRESVFDEVSFSLQLECERLDQGKKGRKEKSERAEKMREKTEHVLKTMDLYGYRNWPVDALSYGQKKRVTIASILIMEPKLLILDEPTAGQDYKHSTEIMDSLKKLNQAGMTIIIISHDMHLALEYTDRSLVLSDGVKIGENAVTEIFTNRDIIERGNLRKTSLYETAEKLKVENPSAFIKCFIEYDRKKKEERKTGAGS